MVLVLLEFHTVCFDQTYPHSHPTFCSPATTRPICAVQTFLDVQPPTGAWLVDQGLDPCRNLILPLPEANN